MLDDIGCSLQPGIYLEQHFRRTKRIGKRAFNWTHEYLPLIPRNAHNLQISIITMGFSATDSPRVSCKNRALGSLEESKASYIFLKAFIKSIIKCLIGIVVLTKILRSLYSVFQKWNLSLRNTNNHVYHAKSLGSFA